MTHEGAVLSCPQSKVQLRIPKGAIVEGEQHEIYVKVGNFAQLKILHSFL